MGETSISTADLREWLADGKELAVLDIRAPEAVGYASPLFATNLPGPRVADEIGRFVPRLVVRTVLVDDGSGEAERLTQELRRNGRTNVHGLQGGIPAWLASGADDEILPTFDTPGVEFSLAVAKERDTPVTTVQELTAARIAGEDVVVIDTRTLPEYARDHVPGAVGIPGAELLLRFRDAVPSETTRVVVSCAGLPRAILGAQTLIDAGVPNPVSYLHDGTKAWTAAGFALETGETRIYGQVSDEGRVFARHGVETLRRDDRFPEIDLATAKSWASDPDRTTYLLDVRTPEEFASGHLEGSLSSEGGQLLGVAYRTIAVRGARIVLIDDPLGVRARTVAHWLQRRGYEIAILTLDFREAEQRRVA